MTASGRVSGPRFDARRRLAVVSVGLPLGPKSVYPRFWLGFQERLAEAGRWRPRLMVQTNRQTPFAYPLPVERFEVDVDDLARRAVALTLDRMLSGSGSPHQEWVQPRLATHQPFPQPVLQLSVA